MSLTGIHFPADYLRALFAFKMRTINISVLLLLTAHCAFTQGSSFLPFRAPSYPLAVRTPYLSTWLPGGAAGSVLAGAWPQFWTGENVGWSGMIRVDGTSYQFLGNPAEQFTSGKPINTVQDSVVFTATQTNFYCIAGAVNITIKFFSPVIPADLFRQSLPFSYFSAHVESNDNKNHRVQIYTDINPAWAMGSPTINTTWSYSNSSNLAVYQIGPANPVIFGEVSDHSNYGYAVFSTNLTDGLTVQSGLNADVRKQFVANGELTGSQDHNYRPYGQNTPVFAFAVDLGTITPGNIVSTFFALGHVRDPAVDLAYVHGTWQSRSIYYMGFMNPLKALQFFFDDYDYALQKSEELDAQIANDAAEFGSSYASILALSTRQAFSGIEITVGKTANGTYNTSDVLVFLKEISSDGNVNTVDVIMPAHPLYLYTNPDLIAYLLKPLLIYQQTNVYPNKWAMHDMGSHYPNATGYPKGNDEPMPIEESGNMLLMTLAHYQFSKDSEIIDNYYGLLKQWADYLVNNTLYPGFQLSTTDAAGPLANQTNLALKGIIGLGAMSVIADITNHSADAIYYKGIAKSYVPVWISLSLGSDGKHIKLDYQNDTTWGIQFNIMMDKLLGLNVIPDSVYSILETWYPTVQHTYGVQLDTRITWGKTDWNMWCAASCNLNSTRDMFIDSIMKYLISGSSQGPLPDRYDTIQGTPQGNIRDRPTVGAHFSLLAFKKARNL